MQCPKMKAREIVGEGFVPESTDQERELWRTLRAKRFGGFKFRRNHPIGPYFADFCCVKQRLIIELDGSQHGEPEQGRKHAIGTNFLIAGLSNNTVQE